MDYERPTPNKHIVDLEFVVGDVINSDNGRERVNLTIVKIVIIIDNHETDVQYYLHNGDIYKKHISMNGLDTFWGMKPDCRWD